MRRRTKGWLRIVCPSVLPLLLSAGLAAAPRRLPQASQAAIPGLFEGRIRVSANLVSVPVSVTDVEGRPVRGLEAADFAVKEDGRSQEVARATRPGRATLELALVLDASGSMNPRFQFAQHAAAAFVRKMARSGDTASLWTIGPAPSLKVGRTRNVEAVLSALRSLPGTAGMTALFDTVVAAATDIARPSQPGSLRVLILLSDGEDNNSSTYGLIEAVGALQHTDCVLYAINSAGMSSDINETGRRGIRALESLASSTGGLVSTPEQPQDLPAVFDRIAADLEAQYLLEYYAADAAAGSVFHRIQVDVPGRSGLRVRSRRGYWSR